MQLIVGLGNPGVQYARTRHNAGFWLVDALAATLGATFRADRRHQAEIASVTFGERAVTLLKPQTFMNASGAAVASFANYFRIPVAEILVAHDELDLAPGTVRLKRGGGHGGHNGLRDITAALGGDFARLRIGIGHPGSATQVVNYVLGAPSEADRAAIGRAVSRALEVLPEIVAGRFDRVMNLLNRRAEPASASGDPAAE
ncbi:MAG: aminoacyl-tRNA hydrolase [Gammaproteobacteria bacterium]